MQGNGRRLAGEAGQHAVDQPAGEGRKCQPQQAGEGQGEQGGGELDAVRQQVAGELQRGPLLNVQNNILVNPDYTRVIARIVSAVAPYPEAREAVIAALRDLDAASDSTPVLMDRRSGGAVIDG